MSRRQHVLSVVSPSRVAAALAAGALAFGLVVGAGGAQWNGVSTGAQWNATTYLAGAQWNGVSPTGAQWN